MATRELGKAIRHGTNEKYICIGRTKAKLAINLVNKFLMNEAGQL